MNKKRFTLIIIFVCAYITVPLQAEYSLDFKCITDAALTSLNDDFSVVLTQTDEYVKDERFSLTLDPGQAAFVFQVTGDESITGVYFDDDTGRSILNGAALQSNWYINFTAHIPPPTMPDGELIDPDFITSYGADAEVVVGYGPTYWGVQEGEWLAVVFNLNDNTLDDVISSILANELRVGLYIEDIPGDTTAATFVSVPVPLPATILLGLLGLGVGGWKLRKSI